MAKLYLKRINKNLSTEEMVKGYYEKDRVEKIFRCLKGVLDMDKFRFWLANLVRMHIFICYLAYLLLSVLEYKIKEIGQLADPARRMHTCLLYTSPSPRD